MATSVKWSATVYRVRSSVYEYVCTEYIQRLKQLLGWPTRASSLVWTLNRRPSPGLCRTKHPQSQTQCRDALSIPGIPHLGLCMERIEIIL